MDGGHVGHVSVDGQGGTWLTSGVRVAAVAQTGTDNPLPVAVVAFESGQRTDVTRLHLRTRRRFC